MIAPFVHKPGYRYIDGRLSLLRYHLVWTVRRRRPVLVGVAAARLEETLRAAAAELDLEILDLAIQATHVHLQVAATPDLSPTQIVYRLKGSTAAILRAEFPELKRMPSMWNGTYLVSSDRNLSMEDIQQYVQAQSTRA